MNGEIFQVRMITTAADIGRNPTIESEQDKKNYKETGKTSGLSVSYTPGSAVSVSGGKGQTNTDSTYESVTKQTGIYAGKEGYDIQVKNNTRLKGAVIDSQAEKEKNKLTTGALTWENIENKAEYKTKASGITVSTNAVSKLNPLGLGYVPAVPVKGEADSTTYSAIADSIITTTKEKTEKEIRHDTENALNKLSEIFDKKKIEEKQELVNLMSQTGFTLIGDIADRKESELKRKAEEARKNNNSMEAETYEKAAGKWSESGTNRIAMHGIMGALVSKEAGAGMTKGLTGAGLNAILQKELGKIKDKEVHKIASAAIGYLAGGKTGAAIAHQATTFNYLTHEQYEQYLDDMKNAKTEEEKAKMKDRWLQIDAEQNEEWLRKQGTGAYIDLSTIKKGDMPGQVIIEKHNRYKEVLNKAALDKSKEIAAEEIASWCAANWMESEYPYLTRKEAEAIGKNLVKKASPFVAGASYLYGTQENHERFKSPYNAFRADAYDTLPISLGYLGGALAVTATGSSIVGIIAAPIIAGGVVYWVEENKKEWETMEKDKKNDNEEIYLQEERK